MFTTLIQRLDQSVRFFLPLLSTIVFVMYGSVSWPLPYVGAITPSLGLIAVFYWSIYRPDIFTPMAAFICGILHDIVNFTLLGMTSIIYVAVHQLALRQRRFFAGQQFYVLWAGFALTMLLSALAEWGILSLYNWRLMTVIPVLLQSLLSIAIFPLPAWLLIFLQRKILVQR